MRNMAQGKHDAGESYSGKFVVRLSPELHERLAKLAAAEKRSLNAEVQVLLEDATKRAETAVAKRTAK
jgi:predicted HicB family RNase H-like nuclease